MSRLYEAHAYDAAHWPASHWRAAGPLPPAGAGALHGGSRADAVIIGAGYAGLNAALELAEAHGMAVTLLEAAAPGWAASGRNAGFVCLGGTVLDSDAIAARTGAQGVRDWAAFAEAAIDRVAENLDRHGIDARQGPQGELCLAHDAGFWARMQRAALPAGARLLPPAALREAGLAAPGFHGGVMLPAGFPVDPMAYAGGLARAALDAGVRLHSRSPVLAVEPAPGGWRVRCATGHVTAPRVLIATNGYGEDDLPPALAGRRLPVLTSILVTRPLGMAERAAQGWTSHAMAYDSRRLLHYFRLLPCGRFLFGMRGGLSAGPAGFERARRRVRAHFEALFPAWAGVETETIWSGLACATASGAPFAAAIPGHPGLFAAFGWHGNGVAAASEAGRRVARAMAGAPHGLPELLRALPPRFPLPALRRLWLALAYARYGLADGPLRTAGMVDSRGRGR